MRIPLGIAIVRGRSMEPTYVEGDRLVVHHSPRVHPGRPHVVRLPDGPDGPRPIGVKRVTRRTGDGWWLDSDNPEGTDSRQFGPVGDHAILARVLFRLPRRRRIRYPSAGAGSGPS